MRFPLAAGESGERRGLALVAPEHRLVAGVQSQTLRLDVSGRRTKRQLRSRRFEPRHGGGASDAR